LDTALQYDNLWQRDHQVGLDYNFSPQQMKSGNYNFYDEPMVASYSGYYRLPLGVGQGLRENYENLPVTFGYDEATHKFNLPPATGNPDLIFYASRASSDTPVLYGPLKTIFTNSLAEITQQTAQHTPTINDDAGTRLTVPLREFLGINSSVQAGFDYKSYQAETYSTKISSHRRLPSRRRKLHDHQRRTDPRAKPGGPVVGGAECQRSMGQHTAHQQRTIRIGRHFRRARLSER
jgi:hypothetical protein